MCGIFGIAGRLSNDGRALGAKMASQLAHRGPDDEGIYADGAAILGNRRLSIIDVKQGHQPVLSDDGKIAVVQNGEIYNYLELQDELKAQGVTFRTHSDTEVLLRMYETYGPEFVSRLNGMFAIAVWDGRRQQMHLYRDPLGIKPLFIAEMKECVAFASEMKALLAAGVANTLQPEAIHHYLSFNYVPPSMTIFSAIGQLPPGGAATISDGKMRQWQWWQPDLSIKQHSEKEWQEALMATLSDAVRIHLRSDVEVGAFLSGGVDSSTVVALAKKHMKTRMHSFSIGFDDLRFDESSHAKEVADLFFTRHHSEIAGIDMVKLWPKAIYHCEQPHGDTSFIPTYMLSQLAARNVKVVLTGDGGDELLGGYERYLSFLQQYGDASSETFDRAYFSNQGLLSQTEKLALYTPEWQRRFMALDSFSLMEKDFAHVRGEDAVNRMLWMDLNWLLPGNNLVKPDRMGMAVGLEARVPFLDKRVIELCLGMPGNMKIRQGVGKYLVKRMMKGKLPEHILYRPKQMFTVPIGEWFKGRLAPMLENLLLSPRAQERGIFDPVAIRGLIDDHRSGRVNHTRILRALAGLEIWQLIFADGEAYDQLPGFAELADVA